MFRKLLLIFSALLFIQPIFATATIIQANSFEQIEKLIQADKTPKSTLLAFDNDDTLTMMPCPSKNRCQYLGGAAWFAWQEHLAKTNPDRVWKNFNELLNISNFIFLTTNSTLTDKNIPHVLKMVDQKNISVLVITDRGYTMSNATENSFAQLKILPLIEKAAIKTPSGQASFPGSYMPIPWNNHPVRRIAYLDGVLYESGQNKGQMIKQFLAKTNTTNKITHIIFVDDTYKNSVDVAGAYKNNPYVDVTCVYYTKLKTHKADFITGPDAKKLQAIATQQWNNIRNTLSKNLVGFNL